MGGRGQGSITRADGTTSSGGGGTVTGANEGLRVSAGNVQLGSDVQTDAAPQLTIDRFLPMNAHVIQFQDSPTLTPVNRIRLLPASLVFFREIGGNPLLIEMIDNLRGNDLTLNPEQITVTAQNPSGTLLQLFGTNAGGAVFGARFRNDGVSPTSDVVTQWETDNTTDVFQIQKHPNAGTGGVDLQHENATVPGAPLRIICGSASSRMDWIIASNIYQRINTSAIQIGNITGGGSQIVWRVDIANDIIEGFSGSNTMLSLNHNNKQYKIGDANNTNNNNVINVDDLAGNNVWQYSNLIKYQAVGGGRSAEFLLPNQSITIGDLDTTGFGTMLKVDDANQIVNIIATNGINSSTSISTASPGGGAGNWKLGTVLAGVVAVDLANYVEIDIGGVVVKLIKAV